MVESSSPVGDTKRVQVPLKQNQKVNEALMWNKVFLSIQIIKGIQYSA